MKMRLGSAKCILLLCKPISFILCTHLVYFPIFMRVCVLEMHPYVKICLPSHALGLLLFFRYSLLSAAVPLECKWSMLRAFVADWFCAACCSEIYFLGLPYLFYTTIEFLWHLEAKRDEKKAIWDSHNHYYISREFHQSLNENTGQVLYLTISAYI